MYNCILNYEVHPLFRYNNAFTDILKVKNDKVSLVFEWYHFRQLKESNKK